MPQASARSIGRVTGRIMGRIMGRVSPAETSNARMNPEPYLSRNEDQQPAPALAQPLRPGHRSHRSGFPGRSGAPWGQAASPVMDDRGDGGGGGTAGCAPVAPGGDPSPDLEPAEGALEGVAPVTQLRMPGSGHEGSGAPLRDGRRPGAAAGDEGGVSILGCSTFAYIPLPAPLLCFVLWSPPSTPARSPRPLTAAAPDTGAPARTRP